MKLSEKAAYIRGLIEGLELDPKDKQTKVFRLIGDFLAEMADEIGDLEQCYDDVCDQLDGIGEDLAGVEDVIYNDGGYVCETGKSGDEMDMEYETTCPSCQHVIGLKADDLKLGTLKCPECGELLEFDFDPDELDDETESTEKADEEE